MNRIIIKLGSAVVADDSGALRADVLKSLCNEVASLNQKEIDVVVVTSGAIARGMRVLDLPARPTQIDDLQAASAIGQGRLYRVYEEYLSQHGVVSAQVLLTFYDLRVRSHYLNARRTLKKLLEWKVVPIINENDTTTTDEISFGDNDFLAAQIAILVRADHLLLLTDIDGLYTSDPSNDTNASLITEVSEISSLSEYEIGHSASSIGTGGMRSKVVAADMATAAGINTTIANGLRAGVIQSVVGQNPESRAIGTHFSPQPSRASSFKLWLKFAKPTQGIITVDHGAERALRKSGTSLLSVGIVSITGSFDAGDAVEIHSADGRTIGKGICNYSFSELNQIKGLNSEQAQKILPRASEEAVHRDYFVLL